MPYTPEAIANYFIGLEGAKDLMPMKLQKLLYFAHGWQLALTGQPLLDERIQAWEFGPVVERLYHVLKEHGDKPVSVPLVRLRAPTGVISIDQIEEYTPSLDENPDKKLITKALLDKIWKLYGKYDAIQLSKMTHEEGTPWQQIRKKFPAFLPKAVQIPNELIQAYFKNKLPQKAAN